MKKYINKHGVTVTLIFLLTLIASCPVKAIEIEAITKPSADIMLSFVRGGRVSEVSVEEGDIIEKGRLLARQEDEVELLQLKQIEALVKNTAKIESVKVDIAQKIQDVEKLDWARSEGAVTKWELDHARLDLQTTRISLRQAIFEQKQTVLQRDELKAQLRLLSMYSPISGQVEKIQIEPGESPQPLTPVIRVVKIDPLHIDVHVPLSDARMLGNQQDVIIQYLGTNRTGENSLQAKITHIAAVADAASNTLRVQLELPNPTRRPAGERILVQF